jgi:flagellar hook-basal body protein
MGYGISLSGLQSASEAIDVTSNNIANAQTVGYKTGEYVFADQFFRAQDPQNKDRAGMGAYRQAIRRNDSYGTIVNSANNLDMAITGKGMFILAKTVDGTVPSETPSKFQYTRNGQFGVDSEGRVVNQSGLFLVGYPADGTGTISYGSKSVLTLDPTEVLAQEATATSNLNLNLDNRVSTLTGTAFSPNKTTSYSQSTSQTVYDSLGESHTLAMYYKKVNSADLYLTGASATGTTFTYDPTQSLGTTMSGEQNNQIATTSVASTVSSAEATLEEAELTYVSGGRESSTGVMEVTISEAGYGYTDGVYRNVSLVSKTGGAYTVDETEASSGVSYVDQTFTAGSGYDNDGTYYDVSLSSTAGNGSGAKATVKIVSGAVTSIAITTKGSGYLAGDDLYISDADAYTAGIIDDGLGPSGTDFATRVLGYDVGANYTDGTYTDVILSSDGSGTGALASITIEDGEITSFEITTAGTGYEVNDTLFVSTANATSEGMIASSVTASIATTAGSSTVTESAVVTFRDLSVGETVILGGRTFTAGSSGATAAQVAATFAVTAGSTSGNAPAGSTYGTYSGAVSSWTVAYATGESTATFTSTTANSDVSNLVNTGTAASPYGVEDFETVITKIKSSGSGATATVVVKDGVIDTVTLNEGGIGYGSTDTLTIATGEVGGGTPVTKFEATVSSLTTPDADQPDSGGVDLVDTDASDTFVAGAGYDNNGTFYNVPLSTDGDGSGAYATIVVASGAVSSITITASGTGYVNGDSLYVSTDDALDVGMLDNGTPTTAFETTVENLVTTGSGVQGSTYTLNLRDGTTLAVKQVSTSESGDFTYSTNVDRFAVFATLDGNAVGADASATNPATIVVGGVDTEEQISLGTMAFVGGKNLDSLARDSYSTPQFTTTLTIDASAGEGSGYGETINGGVVQMTVDSTDMTAYSSTAMTYNNNQDGHATAYLAAYSVDAYGNLIATFDNGESLTKGRVALAYFNNFEGLIPTGDNLFQESANSGEAQTGEYANEGVLGAIRSKALESSNVDLTEQLVKLMVLQRHYSAVSQATKVQVATILDEAINIGR